MFVTFAEEQAPHCRITNLACDWTIGFNPDIIPRCCHARATLMSKT